MLDFLMIATRSPKRGIVEIYPKFIIKKSDDLMIRGGDFYAIWDDTRQLWSTDEQDATRLIDNELRKFAEENKANYSDSVKVLYMWDAETGMIDRWHKYCQKQLRDSFHMLDEKLIFSNTETNKKDYASKRLSYPLEPCDISAYDKLMSTLYSEEERQKIEWAIGAIITGDSVHIQKFMVLYGAAGTGKSTVLDIIMQLFEGYYSVFDAKALGSATNSFALEAFKTNPLVAIQHDGDLSKIEDNTRINSLVSHELMTVNEKFKSTYSNRFKCFLFMGTNKPVKITDGKSGLIRRLIDVSPSGNKLSPTEYKTTTNAVKFELGGIACHCRDVYLADPDRYDNYIPVNMLGASNDFYNFVMDSYHVFKKNNGVTLKVAWEMYQTYCDEARVPYPQSRRSFKEELKNYFWNYSDRVALEDGSRVRSYYEGFRTDIFEKSNPSEEIGAQLETWIEFKRQHSLLDDALSEYPAQYASDAGIPQCKWSMCKTTLKDIDTATLHFTKVPENHIVIDFDIKGSDGNKSFEKNLEAASKWPATYAELSKSGAGIHLHYIYTGGDVSKLSRIYDENIEIKVFTGDSSLRRKVTLCNNLPMANISSGLPLKGDTKLLNKEVIKSEKGLRTMIHRNMMKEIHPGTKPSMDFIYKILEDAYTSGLKYDVSDLYNDIVAFAANSTNQADYCLKLIDKMHFKSDEPSESIDSKSDKLIFYDCEVFPNLFIVNWKLRGKENPVIRMINPTSSQIEELIGYKLIGFNCRKYDNHMLYARMMGYSNEELFKLSQKIIVEKDKNAFFGEAYNLSYTDIYDFASAGNKKSLKKLEIEMSNLTPDDLRHKGFSDDEIALIKAGSHHQELGLPWDKPVPENLWIKVAEYCDNDVIATEAAFIYLKADWTARQILADLAEMTVNSSTNSLSIRIIFGKDKKPQNEFNYRDLSKPVFDLDKDVENFLKEACPIMMSQPFNSPADEEEDIPFKTNSKLPYFPGYKFEFGKSTYRGVEVGEGGLAEGVPGIYYMCALLDIASMHPHSTIAECLFGVRYTTAYRDIVEGRVSIKHEAWNEVNNMLDGKLTPYIQKVINGEMEAGDLANALKTAINSVYGLTSAKFDNPFRDPRNKDNIVAKRGALFMVDLKNEVLKRGFQVAHIKTDSIKIPNATPEIIQFVMDFGQMYGYTFEHEATYERMCLVNDAVYIAKYADEETCMKQYGYVPGDNRKHPGEWTATGTQFAVPYVFKTLFTHEPLEFKDMCETFSVSKGDLYLDMNEDLPDVSAYEKQMDKLETDYKKGRISDTLFEPESMKLKEEIEKGHALHYVGRVGQFTPVKPGINGGVLYRVNEGKNYAATGSKGYRWMESEMVKTLELEDSIDRTFYNKLVDDAVDTISKYGNFDMFVSGGVDFISVPENAPEEMPFA